MLFIWLSHMWVNAGQGRIHSDPMTYAVADPISRLIILLMAATVLAALLL